MNTPQDAPQPALSELRAITVVRDASDTRDDRSRLGAVCAALRKLGYSAYMSVDAAPVGNYDAKCLYWYKLVDKSAFKDGRDLYEPLFIRWQGDLDLILRELATQGLRAERPTDSSLPIRILPMAENQHRFVARPGTIKAGDWHQPCWVCDLSFSEHSSRARRKRK